MTDYEQAVVKYLSLIAQELVRISEAIEDGSPGYMPRPLSPTQDLDKQIEDYLTQMNKAQEKFGKPLDNTRPTFVADALSDVVDTTPKITLEK